MQSLQKMLQNGLAVIDRFLDAICVIAICMMFVVAFGLALKAFAPMLTVVLIILGTMHAIERKRGTMAIVGIVLYILSWYAVGVYGLLFGLSVWGIGILLWFAGVFGGLLVSRASSVAEKRDTNVPLTNS